MFLEMNGNTIKGRIVCLFILFQAVNQF